MSGLWKFIAAVSGILVTAAACSGDSERGATPTTVARDDARFQIVFVGDVLLGDAAQDDLEEHGYTWAFDHVEELLTADYTIGNQEGPITARSEPFDPTQTYSYNAQPKSAPALADVGFDAMGLANNHLMDRGPEGLADTRKHLEEAGITPFGAGMNLEAARQPLLVETPEGSLAVVAYGVAVQDGAAATERSAGLVLPTESGVQDTINDAREAGAEWLIAYIHWGSNYSPVDNLQRGIAAALVDSGFDAVIGHHPHVEQSVELIDGKPVFYSLGNFAFGTPGRFDDAFPGFGLVARAYVGATGIERWELRCIVTDNDIVAFQPRPCDPLAARQVLDRLGSAVSVRGSVGVIDFGG